MKRPMAQVSHSGRLLRLSGEEIAQDVFPSVAVVMAFADEQLLQLRNGTDDR